MIFFNDFQIDKNLKIGITSLLSNITTKAHSHKGGWTKLLKCQLNNLGYSDVTILDNLDSILNYHVIVFDLGAEYKGVLNLFGGLDEKCAQRVGELLKAQEEGIKFYSWQHKLPDLSEVVISRKNNESTYSYFRTFTDSDLDLIKKLCLNTEVFDHTYDSNHILYGDSHTPSVWNPRMLIDRQDGRTLYGSITKGNILDLPKKYPKMNELTIYLGNIDIRHHLMRQPDPFDARQILVQQLLGQLTELSYQGIKINLIDVLPIEDISRDIPKTGWHKGTPYFGTWEERSALHEVFNLTLRSSNFTVYKHPERFYNDKGQLTFDAMERPGSVHLSPMSYRWNLDDNPPRFK